VLVLSTTQSVACHPAVRAIADKPLNVGQQHASALQRVGSITRRTRLNAEPGTPEAGVGHFVFGPLALVELQGLVFAWSRLQVPEPAELERRSQLRS
jgi:hypothetical protein